ncbi:MAG: RNA polymerase subunit sigma-70 [Actinomycetota bacterium]|nr:RNA polymerase subunit sigma-70 [Actinomycetota bacterium]
MDEDLVDRARSGDESAFSELVAPYRRELQVHAYRMLGSVADAEDVLQETLLAAWRGLGQFEGRASVRTWLYRIATNRSLNVLRSARRRPVAAIPLDVTPPEPTRLGETTWLEPYPDLLLDPVAEGPEARYDSLESVSLAFVTALQLLPPRQRAVLVLCDVLAFPAREAASALGTSESAARAALKRARETLRREMPRRERRAASDARERGLLSRLVTAFEVGDVDGVVALMSDDAWLRMPPLPLEYQGPEPIRRFLSTVAFREGRRYRLVRTGVNRQPAFGVYVRSLVGGVDRAFGLLVVTLDGDRVGAMTRFGNEALERAGLPLEIDRRPGS